MAGRSLPNSAADAPGGRRGGAGGGEGEANSARQETWQSQRGTTRKKRRGARDPAAFRETGAATDDKPPGAPNWQRSSLSTLFGKQQEHTFELSSC